MDDYDGSDPRSFDTDPGRLPMEHCRLQPIQMNSRWASAKTIEILKKLES